MSQYLDNIENLTLDRFKLCLKGDYKCLLLKGEYDELEAEKAWLNIYDQYTDSLNTKSNNVAFEMKKQVHILANEKLIINTCLFVVSELLKANFVNLEDVHEFDNFINIITEYGFKFDKEKPADSLIKLQKQIRNYDSRISSELKKIENIEKNDDKWTFDDTIAACEKYMGFRIEEDKTTVKRFVSYLNQMLRENGK